jgi:hypothetical protein
MYMHVLRIQEPATQDSEVFHSRLCDIRPCFQHSNRAIMGKQAYCSEPQRRTSKPPVLKILPGTFCKPRAQQDFPRGVGEGVPRYLPRLR